MAIPQFNIANWGAEQCQDPTSFSSDSFSEEGAKLFKLLSRQMAARINDVIAIDTLKRDIAILKSRCELIERLSPINVTVQTFAPEPYVLKKPIDIVVKYLDDQYIASFFDANISTSGDTQEEAVYNLKDIILATFEMLSETEDKNLGPGPLQQKKVLDEFISCKEG